MNLNPKTQLIDAPHLGQGAKLEVDAIFRADSDTLAIIMHPNPVHGGTMHNKIISTLYRYCRDVSVDGMNVNVVRLNTRGVGNSSGVAQAHQDEFEDVLCVLNWAMNYAQTQGASIRKIWSLGFSFGGYLACLLSDWVSKQPSLVLDKLILIAPSIERNDVSRLELPYERTMMVFSDDDELVTPSVMMDFVHRNGICHRVITKAGHFFHGRLGELTQAICEMDNANN